MIDSFLLLPLRGFYWHCYQSVSCRLLVQFQSDFAPLQKLSLWWVSSASIIRELIKVLVIHWNYVLVDWVYCNDTELQLELTHQTLPFLSLQPPLKVGCIKAHKLYFSETFPIFIRSVNPFVSLERVVKSLAVTFLFEIIQLYLLLMNGWESWPCFSMSKGISIPEAEWARSLLYFPCAFAHATELFYMLLI